MYTLYSFLLTVGFFVLLPRFLWDAARYGKYAAGFWQRFGFLPDFDHQEKQVIWLHSVSVGETQAARPLVKALLTQFPDYKLIVSTTTKTGQKLAQEIFKKEAALVFYFPFDWRFVVRRVLRKIKPNAVLIMETELWFNFLRECNRQNVKVALVNGRLSEKSLKNYSLIRGFMRRVLANLDLAIMSSEADKNRIVELGCNEKKVLVAGNIKFDLAIETHESELTKQFRERFGFDSTRPLIVAASTHEPEEQIILSAFAKLRSNNSTSSPRLLLVPRHPERFGAVAKMLEESAFSWARRSAAVAPSDNSVDVVLLDSIGELRSIYPLATIVFVGGSLIPHGGQNVLEPIAARKPVVTGFYTANFAQIVKTLLAENALVQLPQIDLNDASQILAETFRELLEDELKRQALAAHAFAVLQINSGATEKTINKLKSILAD